MWKTTSSRFARRVGFTLPVLTVVTALALTGTGCGGQGAGRESGPEFVNGGVIFRYFDRDADRVYVAGDFNNWIYQADPMVDRNGDGEWTLLLNLSPGRYEYKFVIDGVKWVPDPRNPNSVADGFEGQNSVVVVPQTS